MTVPAEPSEAVLRPWTRADAEALRDLVRSTADLDRQFGGAAPATLLSATNVIEHGLNGDDRARNWAIVADGSVVGNVGLSAIEWTHQTAWASYWLGSAVRGRGLATRAVLSAADWAFGQGLFRLELGHRVDNPASCAVAVRSGFRAEGRERQKLRYGDRRFDVEVHARLASDPEPDGVRLDLSD